MSLIAFPTAAVHPKGHGRDFLARATSRQMAEESLRLLLALDYRATETVVRRLTANLWDYAIDESEARLREAGALRARPVTLTVADLLKRG